MRRNVLLAVVAAGAAVLASGQYAPAPQPYPQGSGYPQNSYPPAPQNPQYSQPGPYGQPGQYPQPSGNPQDPNAPDAADQQHGIARLSIVQGDVNVKRGDNGELVAAIMNAPLATQDHLQTSAGSRAEVELDSANLLRLAPNTEIGFADLESGRYQLQLGAGTVVFRVLRNSNAQVELDTPSIAIRPTTEGEYRVSVLEDGTTEITVRSGQLEIEGPRGSETLAPGYSTVVRGNPSDPEFQQRDEIGRDQFDDWCANRDRDLLASQSYRYVSPDVPGADDLDAYGNWVPSQYGEVWNPRPPVADWSPYSYGQWGWEPYYGWTWVDYAPWGWAPYHYGRWFWNGGHGWCWWPGARGARQFWSPALVGFFGWGGGFGVGFGGLGWVALAPFESFHPWWRHGYGFGGYGRGDFGVRYANVAGMYRNAGIRGGAMTAGYNGFGGPSHRFSAATRAQLTNVSLFRGQLPVSPARGGYQFGARQATANPRLAAAGNRQFFASRQSRSQTGFGGSRFGVAQQNTRGVAPNIQGRYATRGNYSASPSNSSSGWQRFGDPGSSNGYRQGFSGAHEQSGWHRFGEPQQPARSYNGYSAGRSYSPGSNSRTYGGNYQARPQMHYSAPSSPRYSAPSPANRGGGGGGYRGGGGNRGGGGGHGGGGHPSSGGHRGR